MKSSFPKMAKYNLRTWYCHCKSFFWIVFIWFCDIWINNCNISLGCKVRFKLLGWRLVVYRKNIGPRCPPPSIPLSVLYQGKSAGEKGSYSKIMLPSQYNIGFPAMNCWHVRYNTQVLTLSWGVSFAKYSLCFVYNLYNMFTSWRMR